MIDIIFKSTPTTLLSARMRKNIRIVVIHRMLTYPGRDTRLGLWRICIHLHLPARMYRRVTCCIVSGVHGEQISTHSSRCARCTLSRRHHRSLCRRLVLRPRRRHSHIVHPRSHFVSRGLSPSSPSLSFWSDPLGLSFRQLHRSRLRLDLSRTGLQVYIYSVSVIELMSDLRASRYDCSGVDSLRDLLEVV